MKAPKRDEFADWVVEMMQGIGPVTPRRMFGGTGLFLDGLMFAIVIDSELYLKADDQTRSRFIDLGLTPFTYMRQGKPCSLSYYQAPEETLESLELMREWANQAYGAALRGRR
ncbi:Regulator of competence-specific gene [Marinobacterium lacunae]|uniref:Regulator of competence-specific protein n=1 Tax=Marinobacterium lacunae TaxID=1232683 RepID=A0A081G4C4_9GAMM|nr:TfoX/Sxy family protein [Marinobacterium lacunae]KEA65629.1 Regulator of competence-specific gene [Marinobacterium lacunae]